MAKETQRYYYAEYEVKADGLTPREQSEKVIIQKRKEVILAEPSDIQGYAEGYALTHSSFPGQYKFTGKVELAEDYNAILDKFSIQKRGLLSRIFGRKSEAKA